MEAVRLAFKCMVPVFYLSDGYLANGAEPCPVPAIDVLPQIPVKFATDPTNCMPYARDEATLARPYALPGTPGLEHRIGGIAKLDGTVTANSSRHDPYRMVKVR